MTELFKPIAIAIAVAVLFGTTLFLGSRVQPYVTVTEGMNASQQERLEKVASASLFGQFRSTVSDFLWLKVDKYLHNGVDLRATTKLEKEADRFGKVTSAKGEEAFPKHDGGETTVVPSQSNDWRGVYGNLEREVKPFMDMQNHKHRDPKEALPLFRLMTAANPHFIAGYVTGASMIARNASKYPQAIAFLSEGERNNPNSIEIEEALGLIYTGKMHAFAAGLPHLKKAIAIGSQRDRTTLTEDETEAYRQSFRWLVLNRREGGTSDQLRAAARAGLKVFPKDKLCQIYSH